MDASANRDVLLLFSGGRDSFLSACILSEQKYKLHMVTFENGVGISGENARHGAARIIEKYGSNSASFIGVANISAFWRQFILPYANMTPSSILSEYGELNLSQFNCLTCRLAMYLWSIIYARRNSIKYIADGARLDQGFIVELPVYIEELRTLLDGYGISLLLPVFDLPSDEERKNQLLARGFTPKVLEPQCIIGTALPAGCPPSFDTQQAAVSYMKKEILPKFSSIIERYKDVDLDVSGSFI